MTILRVYITIHRDDHKGDDALVMLSSNTAYSDPCLETHLQSSEPVYIAHDREVCTNLSIACAASPVCFTSVAPGCGSSAADRKLLPAVPCQITWNHIRFLFPRLLGSGLHLRSIFRLPK